MWVTSLIIASRPQVPGATPPHSHYPPGSPTRGAHPAVERPRRPPRAVGHVTEGHPAVRRREARGEPSPKETAVAIGFFSDAERERLDSFPTQITRVTSSPISPSPASTAD